MFCNLIGRDLKILQWLTHANRQQWWVFVMTCFQWMSIAPFLHCVMLSSIEKQHCSFTATCSLIHWIRLKNDEMNQSIASCFTSDHKTVASLRHFQTCDRNNLTICRWYVIRTFLRITNVILLTTKSILWVIYYRTFFISIQIFNCWLSQSASHKIYETFHVSWKTEIRFARRLRLTRSSSFWFSRFGNWKQFKWLRQASECIIIFSKAFLIFVSGTQILYSNGTLVLSGKQEDTLAEIGHCCHYPK